MAATRFTVWTILFLAAAPLFADDPLPSWNDGPAKAAIVEFVERATTEGGEGFVPVDERIATFDNDGTLWCEQPIYTEFQFAIDRIKALAADHPEWKTTQPFQAVLEGDRKTFLATGQKGISQVILATHTGLTIDQFEDVVRDWLATARHPRFDRPYTECIYVPMLEVLAYLRENGFKTFIVSGGTAHFMRPFAQAVYGIPPEQVVGTTFKTEYELRDGLPVIAIQPTLDLLDDKSGKPVGIARFIGRPPMLAFGNSDGDFEMLEYTTTDRPGTLGLFVHHDDATREYAYDRDSPIGQLKRGLDDAEARGWIVVGMKENWKRIFPFEK